MKKNLFVAIALVVTSSIAIYAFASRADLSTETNAAPVASNFKVITIIESILPGGVGRSRMIESTSEVDYNNYTTTRTDGKDTKQGDIDRGDIKIDGFRETKMLNFFSMVGINFQNIASNDAVIVSKLNEMASQGYELAFVSSGVESDAGDKDGQGIFITRLFFRK